MNNQKIRLYNWGIASRQCDTIYINKGLKRYPALYNAILQHEISHSSGYTLKDVLMDLENKHIKGIKGEYYRFIVTHPSTWIEFLPIWIYDGNLVINPLILSFYTIAALIIGGIAWILV